MKQGKTLQELGRELQRQRLNRQDFLPDTRSIEMESHSYGSNDKSLSFTVGNNAHQQIAARLNIPYKYYQKMQSYAPNLLDQNVNEWFGKNTEQRMIRVLDGNVRAFLSDRYRRLNNLELCAAVLPVINEMKNSVIENCKVTPTHFYLKVVNRRLKAEVRVDDVVQAGFVGLNSQAKCNTQEKYTSAGVL